jgi:hypothetical protein
LKQFAIKIARVPIDQYSAKIEHRYRTGSCHVVILANETVRERLTNKPEVAVETRRLHSLRPQVYRVKVLALRQLGIDRLHVDGDVERMSSAAQD